MKAEEFNASSALSLCSGVYCPALPSGPRPKPNHPGEASLSQLRLLLRSCQAFFLYLLLLMGHPLGLQHKHAPPTCLRRAGFSWPHADRRHTNTATVRSRDRTQSKALMDGQSISRGQGRTRLPLFVCLVSQLCLTGRIHLCPCIVETLIGPHTAEHW